MRSIATLSLAGSAALLAGSQAMATLTLNHGNATYVNTVPISATSTSGGTANFRPEGGVTTDHLFANTWHWRINGVDTREFVFHSGAGFGFTELGSGTASGTQSWTGLGGVFNAVLTSTLTDGGVAGQALLVQTMTITNTGPGALSMALFNFADYDVGGTAGTDSAIQLGNIHQITDGSNVVQHRGVGRDLFQVTAFNALYSTVLTDVGLDDLNDTGLPFGPGDYTGAFQWNETIAIGGSVSVTSYHGINMPAPTPGALAMLGIAGLFSGRRRRA